MSPDIIFDAEIQQFLEKNKNEDIIKLALQAHRYPNMPMGFLLVQIQIRKKGYIKLPDCLSNKHFVFPSKLNYEQCSSEITADYKVNLVNGESVLDITGGIGIDDIFFAKKFKKVIHIEKDKTTSSFASHNFKVLDINNIQCIVGEGEDYINKKADVIYLDPARRKADKKIFRFEDCTPNPLLFLDKLVNSAKQVLIKASPLVDIKSAIKDLKYVSEVHVVSVKDEVKEILFLLDLKAGQSEPVIKAVDLYRNQSFSFAFSEEDGAQVNLTSNIREYLYEPLSALYKAGAYKLISQRFSLEKLDRQTHFYTSNNLVDHFPGNIYKVSKVYPFSKKLKKLNVFQANIKTRNFKMDTDKLKSYLGVKKDGGDLYVFGTKFNGSSVVIFTEKHKKNPFTRRGLSYDIV